MMCLVLVFAHKGREGLEVDAMVKGLEISVAPLHETIPLQLCFASFARRVLCILYSCVLASCGVLC